MLKKLFFGTTRLCRFMLKRDKFRLPIWILSITLFLISVTPYYISMYPTEADRLLIGASAENPIILALTGPAYGFPHDFNNGAMISLFLFVILGALVAAFNILIITRHTLQDEENGRLELIRSLNVGRLANASAALLTALIANASIFVLVSLGMPIMFIEGIDFAGSISMGAGLALCGMVFACATLICCQLSSSNRTASAHAFAFMLGMYLLRAIGDMSAHFLTWLSPLGIMGNIQPYVQNNWLPMLILFVLAACLCAVGLYLVSLRDLGRGLIAPFKGKDAASKSLVSKFGLPLRLTRTSIITWSIIMMTLSLMYGSVFGDLQSFIDSNDVFKEMFAHGGYTIHEQFLSFLMCINALIICVPCLGYIFRVRSEEKSMRLEAILSKSVCKKHVLLEYACIAYATSLLLTVLSTFSLYATAAVVIDDVPSLSAFVLCAFSYLTATWLIISLAILSVGLLPKATSAIYGYLGYCFGVFYFGMLFPDAEWLGFISPFYFVPQIPIESFSIIPVLIFVVLAAAAIFFGTKSFCKRDIMPS